MHSQVNVFEACYMLLIEFLDISYADIKFADLRRCLELKKVIYDASQRVIINPNVEFDALGVSSIAGVHDTKIHCGAHTVSIGTA